MTVVHEPTKQSSPSKYVSIESICYPPFQPRKTYKNGDLKDLVDSIREVGILQPLLVRPLPGGAATEGGPGWQLVFGHRRLEAAQKLELAEVPITVRDLTDVQVLEIQLIENCQRVDIHPLEEAEAYEQLHEKFGYTVEEIAAKVGKSQGYVYQRMRLTALGKEGRKAFYDGLLNPSTALLVARIPDPKLQLETLKTIRTRPWEFDAQEPAGITAAALRSYISDAVMVQMKTAPFPLDDIHLVAAAGPCTACPKRSGNQPELFADLPQKSDYCTDPKCFQAKVKAHSAQLKREAEQNGRKVLPAKEAKKAFEQYGGADRLKWNSRFATLDDKCPEDPKLRTYRKLLGKEFEPVLAPAPSGRMVELVEKKKLPELLKEAGHKFSRRTSAATSHQKSPAQKRAEREGKIRAEVERRSIADLVAAAEAYQLPRHATLDGILVIALRALIGRGWNDVLKRVCTRREVDIPKRTDAAHALAALVPSLSAEETTGLLLEIAATHFEETSHRVYLRTLRRDALELFDVNAKAIEKEVRAEFKAQETARAKKKAARAKKKKPAKGRKVTSKGAAATASGAVANRSGRKRPVRKRKISKRTSKRSA